MKVKIVNTSNNPSPSYKTEGSSGLDIRANIARNILLKPGERKLIPTGLYLDIPSSLEAQIRPRSGLAINNGVTVLNTPGTIDSDYRGEIKIILVNLSKDSFKVENGDRIAQIVFVKIEKITWQNSQKLTQTKRGKGGFGSTGKK